MDIISLSLFQECSRDVSRLPLVPFCFAAQVILWTALTTEGGRWQDNLCEETDFEMSQYPDVPYRTTSSGLAAGLARNDILRTLKIDWDMFNVHYVFGSVFTTPLCLFSVISQQCDAIISPAYADWFGIVLWLRNNVRSWHDVAVKRAERAEEVEVHVQVRMIKSFESLLLWFLCWLGHCLMFVSFKVRYFVFPCFVQRIVSCIVSHAFAFSMVEVCAN